MEYLSKERYDEIADELKHLINDVYPKVKDDLAEASAQVPSRNPAPANRKHYVGLKIVTA